MCPTSDPHSLFFGGLYLLLIPLAGYALVSAVLGGGARNCVLLISLCFAAGRGVLAFVLFAASAMGFVPRRSILIGLGVAAAATVLGLWKSNALCRPKPLLLKKFDPMSLLASLSALLIVVAAANVATAAALPGLNDIDSFGIWAFKAKWLFYAPLHPMPRAFVDPILSYTHQDYPLGVPFSIAGMYAAIGKVDEDAAKLLLLPTWLAVTGIVYGSIRRFHRRAVALTLTSIFCSVPNLTRDAGLIVAEIPLGLALAAALGQVLVWIEEGNPRELVLGGFFIALAAFTKNEGLALLPVFGLVVGVIAMSSRISVGAEVGRARRAEARPTWPTGRSRLLCECWPALMTCAICIGPWLIFRTHLPKTHEDYGSRLFSAALLRQIPQRAAVFGQFFHWFKVGNYAGMVWYLLAVTTVLNPRALCSRVALALWAILLAQMALYLATFIVTPWDVNVLLPMITPKLQVQMTPAAILLVSVNLRGIFGPVSNTAPAPRLRHDPVPSPATPGAG